MAVTTERIRDELLVLAAQAGDADAFGQLVRRWTPVLIRHAHRVQSDADAANDAVQETWLQIVRGLAQLADPAAFPAWALCIVGRIAVGQERRRGRHRRNEQAAAAEQSLATALAGVAADELDLLRAAVRTLPPERRTVVELHYLDGLAIAEIAAVLGIPPGTVKSRLFQARAELRARLDRPEFPFRSPDLEA